MCIIHRMNNIKIKYLVLEAKYKVPALLIFQSRLAIPDTDTSLHLTVQFNTRPIERNRVIGRSFKFSTVFVPPLRTSETQVLSPTMTVHKWCTVLTWQGVHWICYNKLQKNLSNHFSFVTISQFVIMNSTHKGQLLFRHTWAVAVLSYACTADTALLTHNQAEKIKSNGFTPFKFRVYANPIFQ
jgi:hypothetical protein